MPWRQWTSGQLVTAPDFQSYVQDQGVLRFATAAARSAAIPTPVEGMLSQLDDSDDIFRHNGVAWIPITQAYGTYNATMNPAWPGSCGGHIAGGFVELRAIATAGTALINTWYDFATLPAEIRPAKATDTLPCWAGGYIGQVYIQSNGLVRISTGNHPSGSTEIRFDVTYVLK